ncbi:glycosyltransferase [Micromonospora sp. WMMD812]|uniref:glycosyltransferase n=1 Tax=Micromonospora sp. WMMD812 TaxID=3015152 RepID=UPI00248BA451|nr:glycosyltransferase [Micromonospora sp. WMMD812]WBB69604.1 glycosyltransferase [Micromonospora sp. WMMD812]
MGLEDQARRAYRAVRRYRQPPPAKIRLRDRQTTPPTVYYLCPDYDTPSGGVRTLYRHVDVLNDAGIPAALMHHRKGFRCGWFPHRTRVTDVASSPLGPDDLLVLPETEARLFPRLPPGLRHLIFNQSGHLTWDVDAERVSRHHRESPDLVGVLVASEHTRDLLEHAFGQPVHRVRPSVDPLLFAPPERANGRTISYLPRRGRSDVENALHILRARGVLADWVVDPVDGVPQHEVARRLRASTIFLTCSYQEGFGLPAAEAMATGNYVIGFHGYGGREFFDPSYSAPVPTGDLLGLSRTVEEVLARESAEPGWCFSRGLRAAAHVRAEYSPERERDSILAALKSVGFAS